ncbi:MAG TPA: glycosyltransferase, partial [Anaerolineae bacterium]
ELAEVLVSPRSEGLSIPLKIYSYLHSGKPTVVTNICAHTQVLDSTLAVIVERDARAYAEGILRLIENPELRTEIGRRAQEYAQLEFSREGYLSKLESVYQALKLSKRISEISQVESPGRARSTASVS